MDSWIRFSVFIVFLKCRAEILLQEQSGFIETEENDPEEFTSR